MNILFYTPVNFLCRDVVSLMLELKKSGHQLILLSQIKKGSLHFYLEENHIPTYSFVSTVDFSPVKIAMQTIQLIAFCWKHKINVLFSHLEPTNLVSVIAQYFVPSRIIIFRHHLDLAHLSNFDNSFAYRLTYRFAKTVITVSARSKQYMATVENINADKIHHINLGYDFDLYPDVNEATVYSINERYSADILLITLGRLDQFKRPHISLDILEVLVAKHGLNAKLIFLGNGELMDEIKAEAANKKLSDFVFFPGFVENVMEYLAAGNFLIHPSLSESSSVAVKEAALVYLPVIVCKDVGDFHEYLVNDINGFIVNQETMADEAVQIILKNYRHEKKLRLIADSLRAEILKKFSIKNVIQHYEKIISKE